MTRRSGNAVTSVRSALVTAGFTRFGGLTLGQQKRQKQNQAETHHRIRQDMPCRREVTGCHVGKNFKKPPVTSFIFTKNKAFLKANSSRLDHFPPPEVLSNWDHTPARAEQAPRGGCRGLCPSHLPRMGCDRLESRTYRGLRPIDPAISDSTALYPVYCGARSSSSRWARS